MTDQEILILFWKLKKQLNILGKSLIPFLAELGEKINTSLVY